MSKKKDIWAQIIGDIEAKITTSEFKTWFSQTALKEVASDSVVIEVPNKFIANWLKENYLDDIQSSFKKRLNRSPAIQFTYHQASIKEPLQKSQAIQKPTFGHGLDPALTFDRLFTGEFNQFAFSSALEVARHPAVHYNPFYIYSQAGVGKTHLLHSIGHHLLSNNPSFSVKCLSADAFTSEFTYAIKNRRLQEFRAGYCNMDLLLFDDIQMLGGKKRTQMEFLYIFNRLHASNSQIVITGDRQPAELRLFNPQLKSRLGWGLLAEIQAPDQQAKLEMIKKWAGKNHLPIPEDVIFFLAKSHKDIKTLYRLLVKIGTYASLSKGEIKISTIRSLMKDHMKIQIGIEDIKSIVSSYYKISMEDLDSQKKQRQFSYPRHLAMYLSRKHTDLSYKEIGQAFGDRDHSTVIYAARRIEQSQNKGGVISSDLKKIEKLLS
jgi:chromosomal replication initiator protein